MDLLNHVKPPVFIKCVRKKKISAKYKEKSKEAFAFQVEALWKYEATADHDRMLSYTLFLFMYSCKIKPVAFSRAF